MELEIDPSGINLTNTYTNTNSVSIDSSNIDISGTHKISLNDTNGVSINNLTIQPTNTLASATNVTIDEIAHLTGVTSNIQTQFNNIIDGAPAILNTLNELATAINDDDAFATTITTSIDTKVSKTGDEDISGIKTIKGQFNYHPGSTISGDMIPESDDSYNLGSVTKRFKHLFVGNSSIWMGEDHKINATGGKLRFRKRKKTKVPKKITTAGGSDIAALQYARLHGSSAANISDLTLDDWLKYGKTLNIDSKGTNIDIEDVYEDGDSDFEEETTTEDNTTTTQTVNVLTSSLYPNPAGHNITWIRGTGNLTDYEYAFTYDGLLPLSAYTWYEHEAKANQLGGNLASIHSIEEQEFLVTTGNAITSNYHAIIGIVPAHTWKNNDPWIGTSHEQWSDGTAFDYRKYGGNEPNDGAASTQYIYWRHNYSGLWEDSGSYLPESTHDRAIYKRPYYTQHTVTAATTNVTSSGIDISGDNIISINDVSGIVVSNLTITPEGSFDICGGNFTISVEELSKLDGISDNIQSQINTAIASGVWDQNGVKAYYNSGNVGIGTDNPTGKFEVVGGSMLVKPGDAVNALQFHSGAGNTNHTNSIEWYNSSGTKRVLVGSSGDNTSNQFRFWENGSQNFVFLNDSNNTKVGINRPDPQYALDVTGDVRFSGNLYQGTSNTPFSSGSTTWTESGSNVYRSSGNVGIGTTSPLAKLHIFHDELGSSPPARSDLLQLDYKQSNLHTSVYGKWKMGIHNIVDSEKKGNLYITGNDITNSSSNYVDVMTISTHGGGRVGIGTTNPIAPLDVPNGSRIVVQGGTDGGSSRGLAMWTNTDSNWAIYMGQPGSGKAFDGGTACDGKNYSLHAIRIRTSSSPSQGFLYENSNNACLFSVRGSDGMTWFSGNVGIGKVNPTEKLDVTGNIKASGTITSGAGTLATETYVNTQVSNVNTQVSNLIVGAPGALDTLNELAAAIGDDANYASGITTSLAGKVATTGNETISGNKTFSGDSEFNNINFTGTLTQNGVTFSGGGSSLWTESGGNISRASGNVGIGTTTPSYKLDVIGTTRFTDKMLLGTTIGDSTSKDWHNAHLYIGGVHNQEYNTASTYKLVIAGSDNEATGNYPIYVIDENEIPLFYIQQQSSKHPNTYFRGKIGIGDSPFTPSKSLDVQGDINFTGDLYQNGIAFSGGGGGSSTWTESGSNVYRSSGNVGIGTSNPSAKLHIETPADESITTSLLNFKNAHGYGIYGESRSVNSQGNTLEFKSRDYNLGGGVATRNILSLMPSGNVGIGTTIPSCTLTVGNNATSDTGGTNSMAILAPGEDAQAILYFGTQHNNNGSGGGNGIGKAAIIAKGGPNGGSKSWSKSDMHFCLNTDSTNNNGNASLSDSKMCIFNNGNVGIGTSVPGKYYASGVNGGSFGASEQILTIHGGTAGANNGVARLVLACDANHTASVFAEHTSGGNTHLGFTTTTSIATPVERMRIDKDGNVGIGITNPTTKLHVVGDINFTGTLRQNGTPFSGGGGGSTTWTESGSNVYRSSGNVGIGITVPKAILNTNNIFTVSNNTIRDSGSSGTIYPTESLWLGKSTTARENYWGMSLGTTYSGASYIESLNTRSDAPSYYPILLQPHDGVNSNVAIGGGGAWPDEKLDVTGNIKASGTITSGGNVGIGTTAPKTHLHMYASGHTDGRIITFSTGTPNGWGTAGYIDFCRNGSTTPYGGGNYSDYRIQGGETGIKFQKKNSSIADTNLITITDTGNVGIGTTSPAYPLHIMGPPISEQAPQGGNPSRHFNHTSNEYNNGTYSVRTSLYCEYSAVLGESLFITSDNRIKTDITNIDDGKALMQINQLESKEYHYIDPIRRRQMKTIGFIAQEVKEIIPNAVSIQTGCVPDEMRVIAEPQWGNLVLTIPDLDMSANNFTGKCKFYVSNDPSGNDEVCKEIECERDASGNSTNQFKFDQEYNFVFFYGKEVNDFHTIDKNQIFALHHSAIQELSRKNDTLVAEKETMQSQITGLLQENTSMKTRLEALESAIINLQNS